jgi:predicted RNase H-like HicB family nuclease
MRSKANGKNRTARARAKRRAGTIHLTCLFHKENGGYVVRCVELDVTSQGSTFEEAKKNILEAIELYLKCYEPPAELYESKEGPMLMPVEVRV